MATDMAPQRTTRGGRRARLSMGALTVLLVGSGFAAGAVPASAAGPNSGTVIGQVFRDFNSNGQMDILGTPTNPAIDVGVAGVVVNAYDSTNALVGTATSTRG